MKKLPRMNPVAPAFSDVEEKFNAAMEILEGKTNLTSSDSSINVTEADGNTDLSASGGDGLPDGYTFEEFTICVDGTPETRFWPTWTTNPEA